MPITEHALNKLGFTDIPAGTTIEATFNSIVAYSIQGINLNEITLEEHKNLCHRDSEFSFVVGNSINEMSRFLINDDFADEEEKWKDEKKAEPPYLLINYCSAETYKCSSGKWIKEEKKITTYDCFTNAKQKIRETEERNGPSIIASLTVQLSKLNNHIRFVEKDRYVYAKTPDDFVLFDYRITTSITAIKSIYVSTEQVSQEIRKSISHFRKMENKVANLFIAGLSEKDKFKKFLFLFQSLEIHTHKTFAKLDFNKYMKNMSSYPSRIENKAKEFMEVRLSESKNLSQRFMCCSIIEWDGISDTDIDTFKNVKKVRDELSHGELINESELPIEDLEELIFKIL